MQQRVGGLICALATFSAWAATSYSQTLSEPELFRELIAIQADQSCTPQSNDKLIYLRKGPKTLATYKAEQMILAGIADIFPHRTFWDVSGLGKLAGIDQSNSTAYLDMIKTSVQVVNEPGLYIHVDYTPMEKDNIIEIQAWGLELSQQALQPTCIKRSILFLEPTDNKALDHGNQGIYIGGSVIQSGSGNINIKIIGDN